MEQIWNAAGIGLIVSAGAIAGAVVMFLVRKTGKRLSAALMGVAGGIMLATVVLDMLPEAWEQAGAISTLVSAGVGAAVMLIVTKLVPHHDAADYDEAVISNIRSENLVRSGLLLAVGIAIHNFPQGIALGSGVSTGFAFTLALLLLLHNIPEGMAMAIPLKVGNVQHGKILWIACLAALPTVVGAVIGAAVSNVSETLIGASVAFAGGAMLFLTLRELIPQAFGMNRSAATLLALLAGFGIGGMVVWLIG